MLALHWLVYLQSVYCRLRHCTKYVVQPVCGLLLLVLLLVCQSAAEKSEVIIYKELKWY